MLTPVRRVLPPILVAVGMWFGALPSFGNYTIPPPSPSAVDPAQIAALQTMSKGVAQIAKQANKAIVFVSVYKNVQSMPYGMVDPFEFFFGPGRGRMPSPPPGGKPEKQEAGVGSGFFIDINKGYIITNNHVVQGADEIQLKLANGETKVGKVVGRDPNTDVAVVKVKDEDFNRKGLEALSLASSDELEVGDFVVALGAPFGLEASLSFGVVSALGRGSLDIAKIGNFIQTDAAINPGNSGGPLIDMKGQAIGLNTAIYSRSGAYNGIGFAVPSSLVRTIAEQLINSGHIRRGYLGVYLQPLDDELRSSLNLPSSLKGGALVARVAPTGPAAKAGLEAGDFVAEVNGAGIKSPSDITTTIGLMKPGSKAELGFYRDGKRRTTTITVAQHPDDAQANENAPEGSESSSSKTILGLKVTSVSKKLQDQYSFESKTGAVVTSVERGSPADRAGLRPGDVVLKANNKPVDGPATFERIGQGQKKLLIWIERAGEYYFVNLRS